MIQYQILDKRKFKLEKAENDVDLISKEYNAMKRMIETTKREMLKNLSDQLKLSVKFVTTSKF